MLTAYSGALAALSQVPTDAGPAVATAGGLMAVGGFVAGRLGRRGGKPTVKQDLMAQRDAIREELRRAKARLAVFIDDLDRLTDEEVRDVAQLVKLIADFPNVVYVLAYDRARVEAALGGNGYVEKIVQVPLDLPSPHPQVLGAVVDELIQHTIRPLPQVRWDEKRWPAIYRTGLSRFFRTARDVKRFANGATVAVTEIGVDVNGVDLLAVTAIRAFLPDVYERMKRDEDLLLGPMFPVGDEREQRKANIESLLARADEYRAETESLLRELFPQMDGLFRNTKVGWEMWRDDLRICARGMYWRYFTLALPAGELPEDTLLEVFKASERSDIKFDQALTDALAGPAADYFLERFAMWVGGLPVRQRNEPVRSALRHYALLAERPITLGLGSQADRVLLLAYGMIEDTEEPEQRLERHLRIARDPSLPAAIHLLTMCAKGSGGRPPLLDPEQVRTVADVIVERVRKMSDEDFLTRPYVYLMALREWGEPDEARSTFTRLERRDDVFLPLARGAVETDIGSRGVKRRVDVSGLKNYGDFARFREHALRLLQNGGHSSEDRAVLELVAYAEDREDRSTEASEGSVG